MTKPLVSSEWLYENQGDSNLIILDSSPKNNQAGRLSGFETIQIKNARFFDLATKFSDQESDLPCTLPLEEAFEQECRKLGINVTSKIVVYDNLGIYTSPRVWWMFKIMGHKAVYVLDGGLPDWISKGFETEKKRSKAYDFGNFEAKLKDEFVKNKQDIQNNLSTQTSILIDARSERRFRGTMPEPREGLSSGHIPNALNIPFTFVINEGKFKPTKELEKIFKPIVNAEKPLIFMCGSGVTACIVLLACELVSDCHKSVFDGSWTEWALSDNLPIER